MGGAGLFCWFRTMSARAAGRWKIKVADRGAHSLLLLFLSSCAVGEVGIATSYRRQVCKLLLCVCVFPSCVYMVKLFHSVCSFFVLFVYPLMLTHP